MAVRVRRLRRVAHRRLGNWISPAAGSVVIAVLLPLATFLVTVWLHGWQLQSVASGSMEPTFPIGSVVVVGQVDPSEVEPGMALVFEDPVVPGRLVTHRVLGRAGSGILAFRTQGDANATPDPLPVPARLVRGRVMWHVTHLGRLLLWLRWPRSVIVLVLFPTMLLIAGEWRARRVVNAGGRHRATPRAA
jgi:signal peptidase